MSNTTNTTPVTVTIAGRDYTLHLDTLAETEMSTVCRITGKRGADGALIIRKERRYAGRALVVGISSLERLNWADITTAVAAFFPACAEAVAR